MHFRCSADSDIAQTSTALSKSAKSVELAHSSVLHAVAPQASSFARVVEQPANARAVHSLW